jgi:hypothetical protein
MDKKWTQFTILYLVLILIICLVKFFMVTTVCEVDVFNKQYIGPYSNATQFWNDAVDEHNSERTKNYNFNLSFEQKTYSSYEESIKKYNNTLKCDIFAFLKRK